MCRVSTKRTSFFMLLGDFDLFGRGPKMTSSRKSPCFVFFALRFRPLLEVDKSSTTSYTIGEVERVDEVEDPGGDIGDLIKSVVDS